MKIVYISILLSLSLIKNSSAEILKITGISNNLKGDFSVSIKEISKETNEETTIGDTYKHDLRDSNGHLKIEHQLKASHTTAIFGSLIKNKGETNEKLIGFIPFTIINAENPKIKAYPSNQDKLKKKNYNLNEFSSLKLPDETNKHNLTLFISSLQSAINLEILNTDEKNLKSNNKKINTKNWDTAFGIFKDNYKNILTNRNKEEKIIFLKGARSILGEVNPRVRIRHYANFLTDIHSLNLDQSDGPNGQTINKWAEDELEKLFNDHFLKVVGKARKYMKSLNNNEKSKSCLNFGFQIMDSSRTNDSFVEDLKTARSEKKELIGELGKFMQIYTACIIGSYKNDTNGSGRNARLAASKHFIEKQEDKYLSSFIEFYDFLISVNRRSNNKEVKSFYSAFKKVLEND